MEFSDDDDDLDDNDDKDGDDIQEKLLLGGLLHILKQIKKDFKTYS